LKVHGPQTPGEISYHWATEGKPSHKNRKRQTMHPTSTRRTRELLVFLQRHGLVDRKDGAWVALPAAPRQLSAVNRAWLEAKPGTGVDVSPR
jgi:hypothetical protein